MFCPNCTQAFQDGATNCPMCGFTVGSLPTVRVPKPSKLPPAKPAKADAGADPASAGVRRGLSLMMIAVAFLPVYKVLAWLYPQQDFLIPGQRSADLFEQAGIAILALLFGAGLLRAIYAFAVERRRETRVADR